MRSITRDAPREGRADRGEITRSFRNENWSCRRAVFGLKISLERWQKVVVSSGSMPQQRQRGSSQQTSSSRVYTRTLSHPHTSSIRPIAIPIPTISSSPSPSMFTLALRPPTLLPVGRPVSRSTPLPPGSKCVLLSLAGLRRRLPPLRSTAAPPLASFAQGALIRLRSAVTVLMRM